MGIYQKMLDYPNLKLHTDFREKRMSKYTKEEIDFYSPATPPSSGCYVEVLLQYMKFEGFPTVIAGWWLPKDNYTDGDFMYRSCHKDHKMNMTRLVGWTFLPNSTGNTKLYIK